MACPLPGRWYLTHQKRIPTITLSLKTIRKTNLETRTRTSIHSNMWDSSVWPDSFFLDGPMLWPRDPTGITPVDILMSCFTVCMGNPFSPCTKWFQRALHIRTDECFWRCSRDRDWKLWWLLSYWGVSIKWGVKPVAPSLAVWFDACQVTLALCRMLLALLVMGFQWSSTLDSIMVECSSASSLPLSSPLLFGFCFQRVFTLKSLFFSSVSISARGRGSSSPILIRTWITAARLLGLFFWWKQSSG